MESANAALYARYRRGDSIRVVNRIDALGVEYALYRLRPIYVFRERRYVDEWLFLRHQITSHRFWNRWVKRAEKIEEIK